MDKVLNFISIHKDTVMLSGEIFVIPDLSQRDFLYKGLSEPSLNTPYDKRINLVNKVSPRIYKMELTELKEAGGNTWAVTEDYKLHEIACIKAKNLADKKRNEVIIKRSLGSIGNGIHWRATITSRAKGEDAVYIRTRKHKSGILSRLNAFTPVVFCLVMIYRGMTYRRSLILILLKGSGRLGKRVYLLIGCRRPTLSIRFSIPARNGNRFLEAT